MRALPGIPPALGASSALVAAAVGLLVVVGSVVGLRWTSHADVSHEPASLQLHAAARPGPRPVVPASPTAAPVRLAPRPARSAGAAHPRTERSAPVRRRARTTPRRPAPGATRPATPAPPPA